MAARQAVKERVGRDERGSEQEGWRRESEVFE